MKKLYSIEYNIKIIILVLLQAILLTACKPSHKAISPNVVQLENAMQIRTEGKGYTLLLSPALDQMPLNQYFDLDVQVKGPTLQVLTFPLDLEIDAGMKAHNHGMNVSPKIVNLGNGQFRVEGMLFHMPGEWFLSFIVRRGTMSDKAEVNWVIAP